MDPEVRSPQRNPNCFVFLKPKVKLFGKQKLVLSWKGTGDQVDVIFNKEAEPTAVLGACDAARETSGICITRVQSTHAQSELLGM